MVQIKIIRHSERLDYTHRLYWWACCAGYYVSNAPIVQDNIGYYLSDSPLTENGVTIAVEKGKEIAEIFPEFQPSRIYTSPYIRTIQTSDAIAHTYPVDIIHIPLLAEYQPYFSHTIREYPSGITTTFNELETGFSYPETYDQFEHRIHFVIDQLIDAHKGSNEDILIVTHGEVVRASIQRLNAIFPALNLDTSVPYLTMLSFTYDTDTNQIIESSCRLD